MDVWQWLRQYEWGIAGGDNPLYRKLPGYFYRGRNYLSNQQPEKAFAEFSEGLNIALQLRDTCWELFFKFWHLETRTYYQVMIRDGLDIGIRATTQAHQPAYHDCPIRAQLFFAMAEIYSFMDAIGYEREVHELIEHILTETQPDLDTRQRIIYLQACMAFEKENLAESENLIARYMDAVQGSPFRETFYHTHIRRICFARGDIPRAFDSAQQAVDCARVSGLYPPEGWNRIWAAALAQRLGNEVIAARLYHAAVAHYETYELAQSIDFYDAVCDYHEQRGEIEKALAMREEQAAAMQRIGSVQYQCHAALQLARLWGRMGGATSTAIESARTLARELKKPEMFLAKVQRVEAGYYQQYEWQI